ncbi:MAG: hypothetical protein PHV32_16030, partial [Eubacteriales bacterium]|nr:hypothetical protein [Eubacteriales bacterium]
MSLLLPVSLLLRRVINFCVISVKSKVPCPDIFQDFYAEAFPRHTVSKPPEGGAKRALQDTGKMLQSIN